MGHYYSYFYFYFRWFMAIYIINHLLNGIAILFQSHMDLRLYLLYIGFIIIVGPKDFGITFYFKRNENGMLCMHYVQQ